MEAGGVEPAAAAPDTQAATAGQDTDGLPPSLTVLVPRQDCEVITVSFTLGDVKHLFEHLEEHTPAADLRLGKHDGITAEDFYSNCAASIQRQENGCRPHLFVLDRDAQRNPPTHRLIRLELLSWAAQPDTGLSFQKPESSTLSDGALEVLAHLWQYSKSTGRWTQEGFCSHLTAGRNNLKCESLDNLLRGACLKAYGVTSSKVSARRINHDLDSAAVQLTVAGGAALQPNVAGGVAAHPGSAGAVAAQPESAGAMAPQPDLAGGSEAQPYLGEGTAQPTPSGAMAAQPTAASGSEAQPPLAAGAAQLTAPGAVAEQPTAPGGLDAQPPLGLGGTYLAADLLAALQQQVQALETRMTKLEAKVTSLQEPVPPLEFNLQTYFSGLDDL
ncbi:hypothetical protein ABPG77_008000 [Micractinium sp. CCAP 211/92]